LSRSHDLIHNLIEHGCLHFLWNAGAHCGTVLLYVPCMVCASLLLYSRIHDEFRQASRRDDIRTWRGDAAADKA
jgi:hypothetical protein